MLCAEARSNKQPAAHLGAMRAFVRVKTPGTRGRPDFQAVSRSADYLRAVAMTSAAQGALAFGVTRIGIFGATSRFVCKSQLKHMQRSLRLCVRGSDAESRVVSIGEFEAQQGLAIRQSLATARTAVRFDAPKEQHAHNASMGSLVKFRDRAGSVDG